MNQEAKDNFVEQMKQSKIFTEVLHEGVKKDNKGFKQALDELEKWVEENLDGCNEKGDCIIRLKDVKEKISSMREKK